MAGGVEHGALSRCPDDHDGFDALIGEDFFQVSLEEFIRRRFDNRLAGGGVSSFTMSAGVAAVVML